MISLIIPVYQVSNYIERCLCSVLRQTYTQIECIIVDDCSLDDSIEKCARMIAAYDGPIKFRILHHERNRGCSAARNTGMAAATGDYIYFMDSDDEILPDCLDKMATITREYPEVELVLGNFETHNDEGVSWLVYSPNMPAGQILNVDLESRSKIVSFPEMAWNMLVRRDIITLHRLYFKEGIIHEDILWTYYLCETVTKLFYCNDVTYRYYLHPNSIVTGSGKKVRADSYAVIYDEILHHLTPESESRILEGYVGEFCRHYIMYKMVASAFDALWHEYYHLSRSNGRRITCRKLVAARIFGFFPNGLSLFEWLGNVRSKLSGFRPSLT